MKAKEAFEEECRNNRVVPQTCLSDDGKAIAAADHQEKLKRFEQASSFAGVGVHHHDAHAEQTIRTVMQIVRAMMLHAATHWPEMADAALC